MLLWGNGLTLRSLNCYSLDTESNRFHCRGVYRRTITVYLFSQAVGRDDLSSNTLDGRLMAGRPGVTKVVKNLSKDQCKTVQ